MRRRRGVDGRSDDRLKDSDGERWQDATPRIFPAPRRSAESMMARGSGGRAAAAAAAAAVAVTDAMATLSRMRVPASLKILLGEEDRRLAGDDDDIQIISNAESPPPPPTLPSGCDRGFCYGRHRGAIIPADERDHGQLASSGYGIALAFPPPFFSVQSYELYAS